MPEMVVLVIIFALASMALAVVCITWAVSILAAEQEERYKDDGFSV